MYMTREQFFSHTDPHKTNSNVNRKHLSLLLRVYTSNFVSLSGNQFRITSQV